MGMESRGCTSVLVNILDGEPHICRLAHIHIASLARDRIRHYNKS